MVRSKAAIRCRLRASSPRDRPPSRSDLGSTQPGSTVDLDSGALRVTLTRRWPGLMSGWVALAELHLRDAIARTAPGCVAAGHRRVEDPGNAPGQLSTVHRGSADALSART